MEEIRQTSFIVYNNKFLTVFSIMNNAQYYFESPIKINNILNRQKSSHFKADKSI
jgi:hypothetical protein